MRHRAGERDDVALLRAAARGDEEALAAWYAPITHRFLGVPPAAQHSVTIAWYAVATAALTLTCVAMRDQWHRYTRNLRRR